MAVRILYIPKAVCCWLYLKTTRQWEIRQLQAIQNEMTQSLMYLGVYKKKEKKGGGETIGLKEFSTSACIIKGRHRGSLAFIHLPLF